MCARAVFRGPGQVCVAVDDEMAALVGDDVLGLPVREALTDPAYRESQLLMDAVYRDGITRVLAIPNTEGVDGVVVIVRINRCGFAWGVATAWRPLPAYLRRPLPRLREPALQA